MTYQIYYDYELFIFYIFLFMSIKLYFIAKKKILKEILLHIILLLNNAMTNIGYLYI